MYKRQLPGPTKEFESKYHPSPDNLGELPDDEEDLPRPPSPAIPQPRTSPRKVRHDWTRARGNLSPEHLPSDEDEEMGSNNEEDPKDPTYSPPDSPMDSDEEGHDAREDSVMEPEERPATPPSHRYPTRQRGFKRGLLELLNDCLLYTSDAADE